MPNAPLTVGVLAGLDTSGHATPASNAERAALVDGLRSTAKKIQKLSGQDLGEKLVELLGGSLKKPVADVLRELWRQQREMRDVTAKKGKEQDVVGDVELIDHSLTWKAEPSIELLLNGQSMHTMKFEVTFKLTLEGVRLGMRNACITRVATGTLKCATTLKCDGQDLLLKPIERKVELPGELDIPHGGICLN